jgi:hypothetical protein
MAETTTLTAPRFDYVLQSKTDTAGNTVRLLFLGRDQKKYAVELSAQCAGLTIAATSAHLGQILAAMPPDEQPPPTQPVVVAGVRAGMRDNGLAGLTVVLENGAEMTLEFQRDDLVRLSALFAEMAAYVSPGSFNN